MNGLGGLNKSENGVVIGLVQLQLPVVATPDDLAKQTAASSSMVGKARRNLATMDLVVFPEYALHGLSMDTNPAIMCRMDGPEVAAFKAACRENRIWGCFSIMELNPHGNPWNTGLVDRRPGRCGSTTASSTRGCPSSRGSPATSASPSSTGPKGCKLALIICHDGMFPEMAREAAYKGAEIMLRTAGYTAPIREAWRFTNQSNAFCNLMVTASVCMCGSDGTFDSMGEAMIVNFDGTIDRPRHLGPRGRDHHRRGPPRSGARGARGLGGGEQHLPARPPRLHRREGRGAGLPLHLHAGPGGRALSPAVGG
jgi:formamidase